LLLSGQEETGMRFTLHMRIADTGIGIPPDRQDAVFGKFTQADVSISRRYGGTGLGLAITRDLVRLMGGDIRLRSQPGRGTVFTIDLPLPVLPDTALPQDAQDAQAPLAPQARAARVLVVDDHP